MSDRESPEPLEFSGQPLVPIGPPPPARGPRPPRSQLPLRLRWAGSVFILVILVGALVIYVSDHNTDNSNGIGLTKTGVEQANQQATVLEQQDQTPHLARLPAKLAPGRAVVEAVHSDMKYRITQSEAGPPLKAARCHATVAVGAQHGYGCTVLSGGVYYDFVAVIDSKSRLLTLCKHDPPAPGVSVPLSPRCSA